MTATLTPDLARHRTRTNSDGAAPPGRSLEQRMSALQLANDTRSARSQLKRDLKAGRVHFLDLLDNPPEWLITAKVYDVLLGVRSIGRVKAAKALNTHKIAPSKTIGGLSQRQRDALRSDLTMPTVPTAWGLVA